jgi:putative addiction module killer protein
MSGYRPGTPITIHMYTIKYLPEFANWLTSVTDATVRGAVVARIKRLEWGLMGDVVAVGDGVSELRIHVGAGWRIYFTKREGTIIFLLSGGTKGTQQRDIGRAKALASRLS